MRLSEEELIRLNPDVYLVQKGPMNPDPSPPGDRPHFQTLAAVIAERTHVVDEKVFSRPGPRNLDAAEELFPLLHPGRFPQETGPKDDLP